MSLSEPDLQELYRRAQLAQNSGYTVARGEDYAALLGGSDGSPAGLIELCEAALPNESDPGDEPSTLPSTPATSEVTDDPMPQPEAPADDVAVEDVSVGDAPAEEAPAAAAAEDAPVEAVEAPADSTPIEGAPALAAPLDQILDEVATDDVAEEASSDSPEYEGWSRKQLLVEAEAKGVEVKSHMSKGDIVAALRAAAAG